MRNIKQDFPIFAQKIHNRPLVYLDTGATSQMPEVVINALTHYYRTMHANVHRGVHSLSERATYAYEGVRKKIQHMLNASSADEIIFTSGTTESINLVAQSFGQAFFAAGDEVIISEMEHHANIVPWQMLQEQRGLIVRVIPVLEDGTLDLAAYTKLFNAKTKLVAITHVSNVLGTINPLAEMIASAHRHLVPVLVDGAQGFPHLKIDVSALDCDFYTFSAHKAYGPTGVGVLYGKRTFLEKMPPFKGGGSMIASVSFVKTEYAPIPYKFEAGTPNIANIIGLQAALEYLEKLHTAKIMRQEQDLLTYATQQLSAVPGLRILGTPPHKVGVISFVLEDVHAHDIATILDQEAIAVRAGHHCAMPLMHRFNIPACVRVSLGVYNDAEDIDALLKGLSMVRRIFHV